MIRVAAFAIAAIAALPAWANCAVADALIDRYGISFSGFTQALPRVSAPAEAQDTSLLAIVLPNQNGRVADGYNHEAWINKEQKRAWILRTGGFAGVYEWYGPAVLPSADFSGCVTEPRRLPPPASAGRQG